MPNSFHEWLQQGEALYNAAVREYHDIEQQLSELEARLAEKQNEVNQIAQVIGKPAVESTRPVGGTEIIDVPDRSPTGAGSNASIARALTGKFGR